MIRVTLRGLLARKLRLLMSGLAVVLGVAFVAGSLTLTDTLGRVFDNLFVTVNAKTAVEIRGPVAIDGATGPTVVRKPIPTSLLGSVAAVPGVRAVTGDVSGYAQMLRKDGTAFSTGGPPAIGLNYDANPATSAFTVRQGRAPVGLGEVALDITTAKKAGFVAGDDMTVLLASGRQQVMITGTVGLGSNDNVGGASIVAFPQAQAERLLGRPGEYDDLRVAAADGVSTTELQSRLTKALPTGIEVVTGTQVAAESATAVKSGLGFFTTFLLVFAGVALFVGAFLIFNTFSMLVAQRQRELALLRALGASRQQVTSIVLVEALVVGAIASAIGLGLGLVVALGLRALVGLLGATLPAGPLVVSTRTVLLSLAVGILVTLVAALLPARKASSVPPVTAMRDAGQPMNGLRRGTIAGAVLLLPGLALLALGLGGQLALLAVGCVLTFLAIAALSPLLSTPAARLLGAPFTRRIPGRLGRLNAMRNPRRTATTAAALMIGLALVSAVSVLGSSARASVETVVPAALGADLVLQQHAQGQGIPADVARQLAALPQVAHADGLQLGQGKVGSQITHVTTLSGSAIGRSLLLQQVSGDITTLGPGRILVSEDQATQHGLRTGGHVPVALARGGATTYTVAGAYKLSQLAGPYLLDSSASSGFPAQQDTTLLISGKHGVSLAALRAAVTGVTAALPGLDVLDHKQLANSATSQIDTVMAFINVLLLLSVGIAVLGIVNTLALSVVDRTRELGLLRAVGLSRSQTRRMITTEAVLVAVFGALLGIAVGVSFGVALQHALHSQGVSQLAIPYSRLLLFIAAAAGTGVLAALLPARRAARLNVLQAVSTR